MSEKGAQQVWPVLHAVRCASGALGKEVKIGDRIVGERIGLEIRPQIFDGIEFGCVRREVLQMCRTGQDALVDELALVGLEAIPDEHDGRAQLPLQMLEEIHRALGVDVGVWMQRKYKASRSRVGRMHSAAMAETF